MFGLLRAAGVTAASILFAGLVATPAMAAEGKAGTLTIETASIANLPSASLMAQLQAPSGLDAQPAFSIEAPSPPSQDAAPLAALRPLHDLVIAFVDYGKQSSEQDCLAKAVYFEARGETLEGQLAVAQVIMNRAKSGLYPTTICEVVTQPAQFSFIRNGQFPTIDRASACWHKALAIADIASKHMAQEIGGNVLWYHASYVAPSWGRRLTRVTQIGTHIFYS